MEAWAIMIWSMTTPCYTSTVIMPSTTILGLLLEFQPRHRPPHQSLCVLTSLFRIHVSDQTFCRRRLMDLTHQLRTLWLALLEPSPVKALTRTLFPMGWPPKLFGNSLCSTCTSPIHKLP